MNEELREEFARFWEEERRMCEPDPSDGPVVQKIKAILRGGLPAEPLGEVIEFPSKGDQARGDAA